MPVRDAHHETVKTALINDGWTITHDPLRLKWGSKDMYVDLAAYNGPLKSDIKKHCKEI